MRLDNHQNEVRVGGVPMEITSNANPPAQEVPEIETANHNPNHFKNFVIFSSCTALSFIIFGAGVMMGSRDGLYNHYNASNNPNISESEYNANNKRDQMAYFGNRVSIYVSVVALSTFALQAFYLAKRTRRIRADEGRATADLVFAQDVPRAIVIPQNSGNPIMTGIVEGSSVRSIILQRNSSEGRN